MWRLIISHIIRHCKFVLRGACTFLKKTQRHVLSKLEQRTRRRKKLSLNRVFSKLDNNGWKMHTGARVRKEKYISIYISLHMKTFLKTGAPVFFHVLSCAFPPGGRGVLGLMFAGYVPLASQSSYPIIVYSLANYRPHLSHFLENVIFWIPT